MAIAVALVSARELVEEQGGVGDIGKGTGRKELPVAAHPPVHDEVVGKPGRAGRRMGVGCPAAKLAIAQVGGHRHRKAVKAVEVAGPAATLVSSVPQPVKEAGMRFQSVARQRRPISHLDVEIVVIITLPGREPAVVERPRTLQRNRRCMAAGSGEELVGFLHPQAFRGGVRQCEVGPGPFVRPPKAVRGEQVVSVAVKPLGNDPSGRSLCLLGVLALCQGPARAPAGSVACPGRKCAESGAVRPLLDIAAGEAFRDQPWRRIVEVFGTERRQEVARSVGRRRVAEAGRLGLDDGKRPGSPEEPRSRFGLDQRMNRVRLGAEACLGGEVVEPRFVRRPAA